MALPKALEKTTLSWLLAQLEALLPDDFGAQYHELKHRFKGLPPAVLSLTKSWHRTELGQLIRSGMVWSLPFDIAASAVGNRSQVALWNDLVPTPNSTVLVLQAKFAQSVAGAWSIRLLAADPGLGGAATPVNVKNDTTLAVAANVTTETDNAFGAAELGTSLFDAGQIAANTPDSLFGQLATQGSPLIILPPGSGIALNAPINCRLTGSILFAQLAGKLPNVPVGEAPSVNASIANLFYP